MIFIFISLAVINFMRIIPVNAQCPLYELYYNSTLSPICDVNCQDLQRQCPLSRERPQSGCYCQPNYARNLQQKCIPRAQCSHDCFPNERPIVPWGKNCENICRSSSSSSSSPTNAFPLLRLCYHPEQRRCICAPGYCRNRNGQCQRNFR
ncbi:inducible metalloproteinase inhibitor protein-like [Musca vetustissima]|uniref:inducible metalloproteinase inhibitor protein-like n=1 Tax=Musca vetustissima TaxID=27455 RepID=UPI002AB7C5F4|nr:inducible metalloproteinase inhibitor protein-like [Musca vetustissima]